LISIGLADIFPKAKEKRLKEKDGENETGLYAA